MEYRLDKRADLKKNIKVILSDILSRRVAGCFNAVKVTEKKKDFVATNLSKLMEGNVSNFKLIQKI